MAEAGDIPEDERIKSARVLVQRQRERDAQITSAKKEILNAEQREHALAKYRKLRNAQDSDWGHELELLESCTRDIVIDLPLTDDEKDGTIAVFAFPSEQKRAAILRLLRKSEVIPRKALEEKRDLTEEEQEELNVLTREVIAEMTANPHITAEWLKENQDRYPTELAAVVVLEFLQGAENRATRRAQLKSFR